MKLRTLFCSSLLLLLLVAVQPAQSAQAHQPYCEYRDVTLSEPWQVPDPAISYAYYGNLYPESDVDYFTFEASAGQRVLLSLSIPAIEGQENFAPVMAVLAPSLPTAPSVDLPARVSVPDGYGAFLVPLGDEARYWYEPFGGRYYWNWDDYFFEAPEDSTYTVALWHPDRELGRYSFVVGQREVLGGDFGCMRTFNRYWTPLVAGENPYRDGGEKRAAGTSASEQAADAKVHGDGPAHEHADGTAHDSDDGTTHVHDGEMAHDHDGPLNVPARNAPTLDLQLIPLDDGTHNVRVRTGNFRFAPQNVGLDAVRGEGHAHLYVDDVKIARIYGEWFHLDALPADAESVWVGLYANDHRPLAIDGVAITDTVVIADLGKEATESE